MWEPLVDSEQWVVANDNYGQSIRVSLEISTNFSSESHPKFDTHLWFCDHVIRGSLVFDIRKPPGGPLVTVYVFMSLFIAHYIFTDPTSTWPIKLLHNSMHLEDQHAIRAQSQASPHLIVNGQDEDYSLNVQLYYMLQQMSGRKIARRRREQGGWRGEEDCKLWRMAIRTKREEVNCGYGYE